MAYSWNEYQRDKKRKKEEEKSESTDIFGGSNSENSLIEDSGDGDSSGSWGWSQYQEWKKQDFQDSPSEDVGQEVDGFLSPKEVPLGDFNPKQDLKKKKTSFYGVINNVISSIQGLLQEQGFIAKSRGSITDEKEEKSLEQRDFEMTTGFSGENIPVIRSEMLKANARDHLDYLNKVEAEIQQLKQNNTLLLSTKRREAQEKGEVFDANKVLDEKQRRLKEIALELGYFTKEGLKKEDIEKITFTDAQAQGLLSLVKEDKYLAEQNLILNDEVSGKIPVNKDVWEQIGKALRSKSFSPSLLKGREAEVGEDYILAMEAIKNGASMAQLTPNQRSAIIRQTNKDWEGAIDRGVFGELPQGISDTTGYMIDYAIVNILSGGNALVGGAVGLVTNAPKTIQNVRANTEDKFSFVPIEGQDGFRIMTTKIGTEDDIKGAVSALGGQYMEFAIEMLLGGAIDKVGKVSGKVLKNSAIGKRLLETPLAKKVGEGFVVKSISKVKTFLDDNPITKFVLQATGLNSVKGEVAEEIVGDMSDSIAYGDDYEMTTDYLLRLGTNTALITFITGGGVRVAGAISDIKTQAFVKEVNSNKQAFGLPETAELNTEGRIVDTETQQDITEGILDGSQTVDKEEEMPKADIAQVEQGLKAEPVQEVKIEDVLFEYNDTTKEYFSDEFKGKAEVLEAIDDIGGVDNVQRETADITKLEATETFDIANEGVQRVMEEIKSGIKVPLIASRLENGNYLIQDGNHRLTAYKELGITEVPIITEKVAKVKKGVQMQEPEVTLDTVEVMRIIKKETPVIQELVRDVMNTKNSTILYEVLTNRKDGIYDFASSDDAENWIQKFNSRSDLEKENQLVGVMREWIDKGIVKVKTNNLQTKTQKGQGAEEKKEVKKESEEEVKKEEKQEPKKEDKEPAKRKEESVKEKSSKEVKVESAEEYVRANLPEYKGLKIKGKDAGAIINELDSWFRYLNDAPLNAHEELTGKAKNSRTRINASQVADNIAQVSRELSEKYGKQTVGVQTDRMAMLESKAQSEYEKSWDKLTPQQQYKVLMGMEDGQRYIKTTDQAILSKLGKGVDTITYKDTGDKANVLLFKGLEEKMYTDGMILITAPKVSVPLLKILTQQYTKDYAKKSGITQQEALKRIKEDIKGKEFPATKDLLESSKANFKLKPIGFYTDGNIRQTGSIIFRAENGTLVRISGKYYSAIKSFYPSAEFYITDESNVRAVSFVVNGSRKGLVMPMMLPTDATFTNLVGKEGVDEAKEMQRIAEEKRDEEYKVERAKELKEEDVRDDIGLGLQEYIYDGKKLGQIPTHKGKIGYLEQGTYEYNKDTGQVVATLADGRRFKFTLGTIYDSTIEAIAKSRVDGRTWMEETFGEAEFKKRFPNGIPKKEVAEDDDIAFYTTARRREQRRYDDITSMADIRRNLDILRKDKLLARKDKTTVIANENISRVEEIKSRYDNVEDFAQDPEWYVRMGRVDDKGAYFSTAGSSAYYKPLSLEVPRDTFLPSNDIKVVESNTPQAIKLLEKALEKNTNTKEQVETITDAIKEGGFIDYLMNDKIESIVTTAKEMGYDGIKIWEQDDWGSASSVFVWNTKKVSNMGSMWKLWEQTETGQKVKFEDGVAPLDVISDDQLMMTDSVVNPQASTFKDSVVQKPVAIKDEVAKIISNYKSLKDFKKDFMVLYHGGQAEIIGEKLSTGGRVAGTTTVENLGKGQDMGGIFFTPEKDFASIFTRWSEAGAGKIHNFLVETKNMFDVQNPEHYQLLKDFVGKKYTDIDGEELTFTEQKLNFMVNDGVMDWATFDIGVIQSLGFNGAVVTENSDYDGKSLMTYVLFDGGKDSRHWLLPDEIDSIEDLYKHKSILNRNGILQPDVSELQAKEDESKGSQSLETYEAREVTQAEQLKMSDEVKALVHKYADKVGEKYLPRGVLGVFYRKTKEIRLKGITDLYVASHEISHAIDTKYDITARITPRDSVDMQLREAYINLYPTAKRTHAIKIQKLEGFAMAVATYIQRPSSFEAEYPIIVKEMFTQGGKYYNTEIGEYLNDVSNIVSRYQSLNDLDRVATRISKSIPTVEQTLFKSKTEATVNMLQNDLNLFERWVKENGDTMTKADFTNLFRFRTQVKSIYENNIATNLSKKNIEAGKFKNFMGGLYSYLRKSVAQDVYMVYNPETKNIEKKYDFNWGTLRREIAQKGMDRQFNSLLVARRAYYDFKYADKLKADIEIIKANLEGLQDEVIAMYQKKEGDRDKRAEEALEAEIAGTKVILQEVESNLEEVESLLRNDGWDRRLVTDSYLNNQGLFEKELDMFDKLVAEDILLAKNVGIISQEKYNELKDNKGYAPFKRIIYDEVLGEVDPSEISGNLKLGSKEISSLKKRTGSTKEIIYPLQSAMRNHMEFLNKSVSQDAINTFLTDRTMEMHSANIKKVEWHKGIENQKDIIIKMEDGVRKAYAVDPMIKELLSGYLSPKQVDWLEKVQQSYKQLFTMGTTGTYFQFVFTNLPRDAFNYITQTYQSNSIKAVYNLFADTAKVVLGKNPDNNLELQYFQKYLALGGREMTFVKYMEGDYDAFTAFLRQEEKGLKKIKNTIGKVAKVGLDILSMPSQLSEMWYRSVEFIEAKKSGDSDVVALEKARRVTTPFHHRGSFKYKDNKGNITNAPNIPKYAPFQNASLQAFAWTGGNFVKDPKIRSRMLFMIGLTTAIGLEELLRAWKNADDDDKEQFKDLTAEDLSRFIHIPKKGGGIRRIAVAEWAGSVAGTINMAVMDFILEDDVDYSVTDYTTALTTSLPDQFNLLPAVVKLIEKGTWDEFGKWGTSLLPALANPIIAIMGYKTYPEFAPLESDWQKRKLPADRYNEGTSKFAKWAMSLELPFDRGRLGDNLNLSPLQLDAILTQSFGRTIGMITGKPDAWNVLKSVNREYYFEYGRRLNDYWDIKEKNDQLYNSMTKGTREYSKEQELKVFRRKAISKDIDKALDEYKQAYDSKDLEEIETTRARVIELVTRYNDNPSTPEMEIYLSNPNATTMEEAMRTRALREISMKDPRDYTKDELEQAKQLAKEFRQEALLARSDYSYSELLFGITKNDDKVIKIEEVIEGKSEAETKKYLASLKYAGMISNDVIIKLYNAGAINYELGKWANDLESNRNF